MQIDVAGVGTWKEITLFICSGRMDQYFGDDFSYACRLLELVSSFRLKEGSSVFFKKKEGKSVHALDYLSSATRWNSIVR